jgi:hypothetical protein
MAEIVKSKDEKINRLKKDIELLKSKITPAKKNTTQDKVVIGKIRTWRKALKKAQRRIRLLSGKKLASKKGPEDKKTTAAAPAAPKT